MRITEGLFFFPPFWWPRSVQHGRPRTTRSVGIKLGGTGCTTPHGPNRTAQSDDRWKVVEVVKVQMSVTPDGRKWTAQASEGVECGREGGGRWQPLLTALNGRPGA